MFGAAVSPLTGVVTASSRNLLASGSCYAALGVIQRSQGLLRVGVLSRLLGWIHQRDRVLKQGSREVRASSSLIELRDSERVDASHCGQAHLAEPPGDIVEKRSAIRPAAA
jgi:hypothetical protein